MASYTPNLDLLKKSPVTDGDDMFNVETMLNENWDRIDRGVGDYTTPAQKMGLTGDLSVGASLGVLANIGNVHVWRKTVVAEEEVPAGYTLGPVQNSNIDIFGGYSNYNVTKRGVWRYSKTISVDANGTISLDNYSLLDVESTWSGNNNDAYVAKQCLSGSFAICIDAPTGWDSENIHPLYPPIVGKVYFFPDDIEVLDIERPDTSGYLEVAANKYQEVTSNPYVPAGTHITYLTSTNRNAYQEGTDGSEKPAGYKLGSKITGNIALTDRTNESSTIYWNYSDQVDVSDDGEVSLIAPNRVDFNATQSNAVNMAESLVGNFIMTTSSATAIKANTVYFIPDDASVAREMSGTKFVYTTAIQSVTGYPAIPAGTTIEYLGVLGDFGGSSLGYIKYGSYVGTGTENVIIPFKNRPLIGFLNVDVTMFTDTNWIVPTGSSGISNYTGSATWSGGKLTLSKGSYSQFPNSSGKTYKYVAFLEGE